MKEYHQIEDLPIALQNEIKDNASFFDNFDGKSLDEQQRIACVLNDCDLEIIAGAGTGKTHTLLAKAAYLIEKKNVFLPLYHLLNYMIFYFYLFQNPVWKN